VIAAVGPEGRRAVVNFMTRPYMDYFRPAPVAAIAAPTEHKEPEGPKQLEGSQAAESETEPDPSERTYRSMVESFSGWPKAGLLFIENTFARMSPLTTAIWFGIVIAGAGALGWAQRTYLHATYDYYRERSAKLDQREAELKAANSERDDA